MREIMKKMGSALLMTAVLGGTTVFADELDWANTLADNDFANTNNFVLRATSGYNFLNVSLTGGDRAIMSAGTNSVDDIRVGIHGDGELEITGGFVQCTRGNGDTRLGLNGYDGTVNMSGGYWDVGQDLAIGISSGSTALFNLSGGTLSNGRGKFTVGEGNSTGRMEISGGSFATRGYADIFGTGTFAVHGTNAASIRIGDIASNDAYWNQRNGGTLEIRIDEGGVTPIEILDYDNDGAGDVTFAFGALLDVGFADGATPVSNTWTVMSWEGDTTDNGIQFSTNVNFTNWSFAVTNNTLEVTYGEGSAPPETNLPPTEARNLYWTGGAGTTDPLDADNWATNASGDTATWGVYENDTLRIGEYHVVVDNSITSVVDYVGGTASSQNNLLIGDRRSGVFNMNSGDLSFSSGASIGFGSYTGNGVVNVNGGSLNLKYFRTGLNAASGIVNVNGGTYTSTSAIRLDGSIDTGAVIGWGTSGYGELNVSGGSFDSRFGAWLGYGGAIGNVTVDGSSATSFGFGTISSANGFWYQGSNSTLSLSIDEGGVTPITINGDRGVDFADGSIITMGWAAGVTNYGVFDVMTWNGSFTNGGLTMAANVDSSVWSFAFADGDGDGTNDTLQVIADPGDTANGTPYLWLWEHGLTEADEFVDNDTDGLLTWEEYVAGTDPTNDTSVLVVNSVASGGGDFVITWQSVAGKSYSIVTNTSLTVGSPGVEASGITGLPNETSYTGTISGADNVFYEVGVQ